MIICTRLLELLFFTVNQKLKPISAEIFHVKFVIEINELQSGIFIDDTYFKVCLKCIIADMPARQFLTNILGNGGIFAYERSSVKGVRVEKRTVPFY